jgi:ADP-ribosyl-[dinitrogen reductase] hydrolase
MIELNELGSRSIAAFLGVAIGDALGAPVEFMTSHEIQAKFDVLKEMVGGGWLRLKPGQVTDDTDMSLCIARGVVTAHGWSLTTVADNFARWLRANPVDVGDTCRRGIRNYMLHGTIQTPVNQWDAGNGALMRMVPAALCTLGDRDLMERCVLEQARLTHNHPLSDAACCCYGRLLHLAIAGRSKTRLRREVDAFIDAWPVFAFTPYRGLATGYVVDTFQTVCHYFFRGRDFEECVVGAVNQGGDADTTGAIIGGLAGAYYGLESIPQRWRKKLDRKVASEINDLALALVKLSPHAGNIISPSPS